MKAPPTTGDLPEPWDDDESWTTSSVTWTWITPLTQTFTSANNINFTYNTTTSTLTAYRFYIDGEQQ